MWNIKKRDGEIKKEQETEVENIEREKGFKEKRVKNRVVPMK